MNTNNKYMNTNNKYTRNKLDKLENDVYCNTSRILVTRS